MAMRDESNPLEAVPCCSRMASTGTGETLRIPVNEAAKIERDQFIGARPYEGTATRRDYAEA